MVNDDEIAITFKVPDGEAMKFLCWNHRELRRLLHNTFVRFLRVNKHDYTSVKNVGEFPDWPFIEMEEAIKRQRAAKKRPPIRRVIKELKICPVCYLYPVDCKCTKVMKKRRWEGW